MEHERYSLGGDRDVVRNRARGGKVSAWVKWLRERRDSLFTIRLKGTTHKAKPRHRRDRGFSR